MPKSKWYSKWYIVIVKRSGVGLYTTFHNTEIVEATTPKLAQDKAVKQVFEATGGNPDSYRISFETILCGDVKPVLVQENNL